MKKLVSIVFLLLFLVSSPPSLASSELNLLWDVPMGISIKEASEAIISATGATFEYGMDSNNVLASCNTPSNSPVVINGLDYTLWVSCLDFNVKFVDPPTYQSLMLQNEMTCPDAVQEDVDYFLLYYGQTISKVYSMLHEKFGSPDYGQLFAGVDGDGWYAFDIPTFEGDINLSELLSQCSSFTLCYIWNNIQFLISVEHSQAKAAFVASSFITQYTVPFEAPELEEKGDYATFANEVRKGLTSF